MFPITNHVLEYIVHTTMNDAQIAENFIKLGNELLQIRKRLHGISIHFSSHLCQFSKICDPENLKSGKNNPTNV